MRDHDRAVGELLNQLEAQPPRLGFRSELRAQLVADLHAPSTSHKQKLEKPGGVRMEINRGLRTAVAAALVIVIGGGGYFVWTNRQNEGVDRDDSAKTPSAEQSVPLSLAATVKAKSIEAITRATSLAGTMSYQQYSDGKPNGEPIVLEFHVDSRGDRWVRAVTSGTIEGKPFRDENETSYDVGSGTRIDLWTGTSGNRATVTERADQGHSLFDSVYSTDVLSEVVRTMDTSGEAAVREITHNGRTAWQFEPEYESASLVIDQETGFPVQGTYFDEGKALFSFTATELRVNPSGDPKTVIIPSGTTVDRQDDQFQVVTRDEIVARANLHPYLLEQGLAPEFAGFVLQSLVVDGSFGGGAGGGDKKPVKAIYRRGLQTMAVSTWPNLDAPAESGDPIYVGEFEGYASAADVAPITTVDRGAFAGAKLRASFTRDENSHVWASNNETVVVIMGSFTKEQFISLANLLAKE